MSESKISCPHCAQHIVIDDAWAGQTLNCPSCQQPFVIPGTPPTAVSLPPPPPPAAQPAPGLRLDRPATPPPVPPPRSGPAPVNAPAANPTRTSGLAIASLVLSFFGCLAIGGVICGHLARKQMRRDPALGGRGLAMAGLIIGYLSIALTAGLLALGVFGFFKARQKAMEMQSHPWNATPADAGAPEPVVPRQSRAEQPKLPVPADAVSGTLKGQPFTCTHSSLHKTMSMFTISDGEDFFADREVKVFLFLKPGESLENRTWKFNATGMGMFPHVHLSWKENDSPKMEIVSTGYQLELKTSAITNGVISGSLNLTVTGKTPADLKGNFTAKVE